MKNLMNIIRGAVLGTAMAGLGACATVPTMTSVHYKTHMGLYKKQGCLDTWYRFGLIKDGKTPQTADRKVPIFDVADGTSFCSFEAYNLRDNQHANLFDVGCDDSVDFYEGNITTPAVVGMYRGENQKLFEEELDPFFKERARGLLEEGQYMEKKLR